METYLVIFHTMDKRGLFFRKGIFKNSLAVGRTIYVPLVGDYQANDYESAWKKAYELAKSITDPKNLNMIDHIEKIEIYKSVGGETLAENLHSESCPACK